jgi:hypothetical protein
MKVPPSDQEIQRRIANLLKTPVAGRAVAGHLKDQAEDWAHRATICDLRARRLEAQRGAAAGRVPVAGLSPGHIH